MTNVGHDRDQLSSMARKAREAIGGDELTVFVDRGYFKGEEILHCERMGIQPHDCGPSVRSTFRLFTQPGSEASIRRVFAVGPGATLERGSHLSRSTRTLCQRRCAVQMAAGLSHRQAGSTPVLGTSYMIDRSNGYEGVAAEFLAGRGGPRSTRIGAETVRVWARQLAQGSSVLDLGCGSGVPITEVLIEEGLAVYGVDASPSLVRAFKQRWPRVPVTCEPVEESPFFDRQFDAVLAWGLVFLLPARSQRELIGRISAALRPGGRLLFTSPEQVCCWRDVMTGRESRSLGAAEYQHELSAVELRLIDQYDDEGKNHYYDAVKDRCAVLPLKFGAG